MSLFKFLVKSIKKFVLNILNFGVRVAFFSLLFDLVIRIKKNFCLKGWIIEQKHKAVKNYIKSKYGDVIHSFSKKKWTMNSENNHYVWICWWQGEENLDELTSCCVKSIRKCAKEYSVKFITELNYRDYVCIPSYIIDKMNKGVITFTQFSDILRMNLLYKYGGLWLDATMFLTKEIPNDIFDRLLYSQKGEKFGFFVSECMWSGFFIGGNRNGLLFEYMKDMFAAYWGCEKILIDYYLIDYLIKIGYEEILEIRKCIDDIPCNNPHIYSLEALLNQKYDEEVFSRLNDDTSFYKLSRKSIHNRYTEEGEETFYYHIINL